MPRQANCVSGAILCAHMDAFVRQICETVLGATLAPDGEDFRAAIRFSMVGRSGAAHLRVSQGVLTRRGGPRGIVGAHFLVLVLNGTGFLTAGEVARPLAPNSVVIINGDLDFSLTLSAGESGCAELDWLQLAGAEPPALAKASGVAVTTSALLANYIVGLAELVRPEGNDIGPCRPEIPIIDYIDTAIRDYLTHTEGKGGSRHDQELYGRIKTFIVRNVKNPALDAALLAREFAISRRTLYSVFYDHGSSLRETIMTARLEAARREIELGGRKVASVILDHGFSSPSTFYRNYKHRFGHVPRS